MNFTHRQVTIPIPAEFSARPPFTNRESDGPVLPFGLCYSAPGHFSDFFSHSSHEAGSAPDTMAKSFLFSELVTHCPFHWEHSVPGSCTFGSFFKLRLSLTVFRRADHPNREFLSLPLPPHHITRSYFLLWCLLLSMRIYHLKSDIYSDLFIGPIPFC